MAKKTQEEIEQLKDSWMKDPCWDIEDTDGFEEHREELLQFHKTYSLERDVARQQRNQARIAKVGLETGVRDAVIAQALYTFEEIASDARQTEQHTDSYDVSIGASQVRATLLLAAQTKRLADLLGDLIDQLHGESDIAFNTKLYKVDD